MLASGQGAVRVWHRGLMRPTADACGSESGASLAGDVACGRGVTMGRRRRAGPWSGSGPDDRSSWCLGCGTGLHRTRL